MRIEILSEAEDDLVAGAKFYERRRALNATTRGSSPVRAARLLLPLGPFLVADFRLEYPRDSTPSRPRAQSLNSVFRAATMLQLWNPLNSVKTLQKTIGFCKPSISR